MGAALGNGAALFALAGRLFRNSVPCGRSRTKRLI